MIWKKSEADEAANQIQPQPQPQPSSALRGQPPQTRERALVGASIEVKGSLTGNEDLFIEGSIEGKIELRQHSVTIGKSGRVKADIYARTVVVMGEINGNLFGEEQIILRQTSTVYGNLLAPRVTLEDGAHFKGSIDMTPPTSADAVPAQASASGARQLASQMPRHEQTTEKS
jgi:cytoskeletal protein CcmA (bactofilin family)